MLAITIKDTQKVLLTLSPINTNNQPVTLTAPINVSVVSGTGTAEIVSGNSLFLVSGKAKEDTVYLLVLTGDFGEGVASYPLEVVVTSKSATDLPDGAAFNGAFSAPVAK